MARRMKGQAGPGQRGVRSIKTGAELIVLSLPTIQSQDARMTPSGALVDRRSGVVAAARGQYQVPKYTTRGLVYYLRFGEQLEIPS
jgi:hypothetical protein